MLKRILSVLSVGLVTMAAGSASAATILPGQTLTATTLNYGGTQISFSGGSPATSAFSANYSVAAYVDPSNVFCAGCLDFVYQIDETGPGSVASLSAGSFGGYQISAGYFAQAGPIAPTDISRSADGSMITFLFDSGVAMNDYSDFLILQTNVTAYTYGTTTLANGDISYTGIGLEPTPEPSSFLLLGTGLIGLAGVARGKFGI